MIKRSPPQEDILAGWSGSGNNRHKKVNSEDELLVWETEQSPLTKTKGAQMRVVGFEDGEEGKGQIVGDLWLSRMFSVTVSLD